MYAIGARSLLVGIPGEPAPRCIQTFGPQDSRRVDDFRPWSSTASTSLYRPAEPWGRDWALWGLDIRGVDLGLVEDKIERAIRDAHTKYLLLDQRSRRAVLALPTGLSDPLLYVILRTVFTSTSPSTISLWSNPLLSTVSAGLRSALVVDIGWEESTVTAIYEYREVLLRRTVRAAKALTRAMAQTLEEHTGPEGAREQIGFETAEDIMERMAWCRKSHITDDGDYDSTVMPVPIKTEAGLSTTLRVPFGSLAEPVERTFFDSDLSLEQTDDHIVPLHILAYRCLLALPLDVRAVCMSRIIVTGGVSNIPGLKPRLLGEIEGLVKTCRWDPIMNYGSATATRQSSSSYQSSTIPVRVKPPEGCAQEEATSTLALARESREKDDISDKLAREAAKRGVEVRGVVRGVETLGAWAGASLVTGLKVEGMLEVRKDEFMKYGLACFGSRLDAI